MSKQKRTMALDFDGVLHKYSGYNNGLIQGPIDGALEAVNALLSKGHTVVVFTTRPKDIVEPWLVKYGFPRLKVSNIKDPFWVIVDDRAIQFNGKWSDTIDQINNFQPYWIKERNAK